MSDTPTDPRDRDLREANPDDIRLAIRRALISAQAVRAQQNAFDPSIDAPLVDPRHLAVVITKLEEADLWLGLDRKALGEALGLLNSMVLSGEQHSPASKALLDRARAALR